MAKRSPKLLFTDEERNTPELKRAVKKADKSIAKLEKAEANIPKKRIKKKQRFIDENSGKVKTKIMFEEVDKKKPSSQLKSEVRTAPAQFAAGAAVNILRDNEDDSAATNITHSVEKTADTSIRAAQFANRSSKLKPYYCRNPIYNRCKSSHQISQGKELEGYQNELTIIMNQKNDNTVKLTEKAEDFLSRQSFTNEMLLYFIDKIKVYSGNKIEIVYRFQDVFNNAAEIK